MKSKLILPLAFLLLFSYRAETQETVTVSTGEWAPYTTEEDEFHGVALHIVSAAFQAVGLQVEYQWYPWARAMHEAEVSNTDFSGIWFYNEDRASKFDYTDPVISSVNVFFKRKDNDFDWTDYDSFPKDKLVGRTISYSYGEEFDEAVKTGRVNVDDARNDTLNFRKLIRGRIDAFAVTDLVGYALLKKEFRFEMELLDTHPMPISEAPLHLISAKGNRRSESLIPRFNRGMEMLRESGDLDRILDLYR